MHTRYADAPFWAPETASALDTFRERKEIALLRANSLLLSDDVRARALAENGVYAYAELRLRFAGGPTSALLREVESLRMEAGARAEQLLTAGSLDPSAAAAELAYRQVESILASAKTRVSAGNKDPAASVIPA